MGASIIGESIKEVKVLLCVHHAESFTHALTIDCKHRVTALYIMYKHQEISSVSYGILNITYAEDHRLALI